MVDLFLDQFNALGQQHIVEKYNSSTQQDRATFRNQIEKFNKIYPGGIKAYVENARKLLKDSKQQINPYQGFKPSIPKGATLDYENQNNIIHYETIGEKEMKYVGFVLVAGGLGERLGYKGIKIEIPIDTATETNFIQYYISYILSVQQKLGEGKKIPFAILTSDDTHDLTKNILETNSYYGMDSSQIILMKQWNVPTFIDLNAKLSLIPGKLMIETKPHGHGLVHSLLYSQKVIENWQKNYNTKWIIFFQDTNPLILKSMIATIGVSKQLNLEMNTLGIKFKPGEKVGTITKLTDKNGRQLVINVEYNYLNVLLKQIQGPIIDKDGYCVLPGGINGLILDSERYLKILQKTKGRISEFINPKYTDDTLSTFTNSTRIECMMQDYPKLLDNCQNIGFTIIDRRFCFSALKNNPKTAVEKLKAGLASESANSCEADMYECNRLLLKLCGAEITHGDVVEFNSIPSCLFPRIFLSPKFAITLKQLKSKVKKLKVSADSTLAVMSDCILQDVEVDGTLRIQKEGNIITKETTKNYEKLISTDGSEPEWLIIRGYKTLL